MIRLILLWLVAVTAYCASVVNEPDDTDTISGFSFDFTLTVDSQPTLASVEWYVNQRLLGTVSSAPWTLNWTTYDLWNGSHTVYAVLKNGAGTVLETTATNTFTIANGSETIAVTPSTAYTSPWSGTITFGVTITRGDSQESNCYLYVDGVLIDSDYVSGTTCNTLSIDTSTLENGTRRIFIQASNAYTNIARGMYERDVTVANTSTNQVSVEAGASEVFLTLSGTTTLTPRIRLADSSTVSSTSSLPAIDNFNRSNSSTLTGSWITLTGAIQITSNEVTGNSADSSTVPVAYWNADTFPTDQYAEVTYTAVSGDGSGAGVSLRIHSGTTGPYHYLCAASNTAVNIGRIINGASYSSLNTTAVAFTIGDVLRCEVSGTGATVTITAKKNGSLVLTATDTNSDRILYGQAGVFTYLATGTNRIDGFSAGALDASSGPAGVYISSDAGVATVSTAGVVTGVGVGDTNILVFARGLSRTIRASVNTANTLPHFSASGSTLTSYSAGVSMLPRSWFFSNIAQLTNMTAEYTAGGFNAWEEAFYSTPLDGQSEASWESSMDSRFTTFATFAGDTGLKLVGIGDEIARTNTALYKASRGVWRTWTPDSITYGFQKAKDSGFMVMGEMVDEVSLSWGHNPFPQGTVAGGGPFTQIVAASSVCTVTWTNWNTSGAQAIIVSGATSDTDLNTAAGSTKSITFIDADHFSFPCASVSDGTYNSSTDSGLTLNVFGDTWFDSNTDYVRNSAFTTIMTNANLVSGRTPIAWPVSGSAGILARQNWADTDIADYASPFWAASAKRYPYGQSINDAIGDMRSVYREAYSVIQRDKPWVGLVPAAGPMYRIGGVPVSVTSIASDSTITFAANHNLGSLDLGLDRITITGSSALNGNFYVWSTPSATTAKIAYSTPQIGTDEGFGGTVVFDGGPTLTVISMQSSDNWAVLTVNNGGGCDLPDQVGKSFVVSGNSNSAFNKSWFYHTLNPGIDPCDSTGQGIWALPSTASTGGTAYVIATNAYVAGRSQLMVQGVHPTTSIAGYLYLLFQGAGALRCYGLSNTNPDADANASRYFQDEPSSGDGINFNSGPLYDVNGMQDRWNAISAGAQVTSLLEPLFLQPRGQSPDYGPGIVCTKREGGSRGNLIGCLNITDGYIPRTFDLSSLSAPATRYRITKDGYVSSAVVGSSQSLTMEPGEGIVWASEEGVVTRVNGGIRISLGIKVQ